MDLTKHASEKLQELEQHMIEEGDALQNVEAEEVVWSMNAKLTHKQGDGYLWAVPSEQDWIHDALDDVTIIPGVIYADEEPFLPGSIELTGYFQADETGKWVRVERGQVPVEIVSGDACWKSDLSEFEEVAKQLEAAMEQPEYRHMAEKAALEQLSGCKIKSI